MNLPGNSYVGLFSSIEGAEIKNLGILNADVTGNTKVGTLVGSNVGSTISNCYCTGIVINGNGENVGGLIGYSDAFSQISNCFSTGTITGSCREVGGLVGSNYGSISNCYSTVNVNVTGRWVGGLIGTNITASANVEYCYSTGYVNGSSDIGGLIGTNTGNVTNSFWDTQTSGKSNSHGGTGKTTLEMKTLATFTNTSTNGLTVAWDFVSNPYDDDSNENYWDMDYSGAINNGYPYLSWEDGSDISLPVEIAAFSARCEGKAIVLAWITESELDNLGFILERSEQTDVWIQIASYETHDALKGQGTTSTRTDYAYTDINVEFGKEYKYRLSDVSMTGEVTVYASLFIYLDKSPETTEMENAYPNPFNPQTYIAYYLTEEMDVNIMVLDMLGCKVKTLYTGHQEAGNYHVYWNGNTETNIKAPSGLYLICMRTETTTQVQKVMLMK